MIFLNSNEQACLRSVYAPPLAPTQWDLAQLAGHDRLRYFAYGRHALIAALHVAGVTAGDVVLMPGFICRELLSAIHAIGARVEYYAVDAALGLADDAASLPAAKVIVAVDYFGFAQDLAPFRQYCMRTGALLIEDNAHGLFSRDSGRNVLGTRGDLGIFSIRKTLTTPDGAAVIVNNLAYTAKLPPQTPFSNLAPAATFRSKQRLRKLARLLGPWPARMATTLTRQLRRLRTGHAIPPSSPQSETQLPGIETPNAVLRDVMRNTDVDAEIARRRDLYHLLPSLLDPRTFPPLFPSLPPDTVPYGYPFIANPESAVSAGKLLSQHGLECIPWPALPDAISANAPAHYRSVWMVSFLW